MDIPFARFVEFVDAVSQGRDSRLLFERWTPGVPKSLGPTLFRLLFPELDIARRFSFSEPRLARALGSILRIPDLKSHDTRENGCLGSSVATLLATRRSSSGSGLTLRRVDELLSELAAISPWSHRSVRAMQKRPEGEILAELYADAGPLAAALLTQHAYTTNKAPRTVLTPWDAMRAWDPRMTSIYRVRADLTVAAQTLLSNTNGTTVGPLLGVPIEIPKCFKARSIKDALHTLNSSGAEKAFAEVKYDGERMQIHVDFSKPTQAQVTIFSKSKRDSTWDRAGTHPIIRAALGLSPDSRVPGVNVPPLLVKRTTGQPDEATWSEHLPETLPGAYETTRTVKNSVILECEMVAYDESRGRVDEFWRVRNLVESTAIGVRARRVQEEQEPDSIPSDSTSSQRNSRHNAPKTYSQAARHLALIFFDILSLDGQSLLGRPFEQRRKILEEVVRCVPGWVGISNGAWINLTEDNNTDTQSSTQSFTHPSHEALIQRFSQVIADYEEGLVVKPCSGGYNYSRAQWVKMKKDYIPGLGDCADFVVIGAGHDKDRGRELGGELASSVASWGYVNVVEAVGPGVLTTFYIGVRTNEDSLGARAVFDAFSTVSYGLSREQLEDLNHKIQSVGAYEAYRADGRYMRVPYDVQLASTLRPHPPKMWLLTPMLFELMGAGFTKSEATGHYELRFPRITKIHSPTDRPWTCGLGMRSLQRLAKMAVGLVDGAGNASAEEVVDRIWGEEEGGSGREERRRGRVERWVKALGGKQVQENAVGSRSDTNVLVSQSARYTTYDVADELGCPSDWEDITEDELEMSDMEFEGGSKRTRTREEARGQNDQGDILVTEAPRKRPRLVTPGPPSMLGIGKPVSCLGEIDPGTGLVCSSKASPEDIPDKTMAPTHTEPSTPHLSPPKFIHSLTFEVIREEHSGIVQSCVSTPDCPHRSLDPSLLLADAFIYVAHRSAPHPTILMPASRRVFSQDALLAGLDWTGARRKRRALGTHIPTNQTNQATRIRKGMVIVDHERDDTPAIVNWAQSLGTQIHPSHLRRHVGEAALGLK
ncbi:hypothetical protein FRC10_007340 [Ceratobasidium sp. 414]|nr:hypothetical protein FRC10_007340 [Ceratobasidium sp. 414]